MFEVKKVGKRWYTVKGEGINAEVTVFKREIYPPPDYKRIETNKFTITGAGSVKGRNKIIALLTMNFPNDFITKTEDTNDV